MLLFTFQPIYSKADIAEGLPGLSHGRHAAAGYPDPVWCCGGDLAQMWASAYFAAPRFPDLAVFVETDDFVRVDKAGWYRYVRDGRELDASLLDPDLPDYMCEFLIDASTLDAQSVLGFPLLGLGDMMASDEQKVELPFFGVKDSSPPMPNDQFSNACSLMSRYLDLAKDLQISYDGAELSAYRRDAHKSRLAFLHGLFPLLYAWLMGTITKGVEYAAWLWHMDMIRLYASEFYPWQESACDAAGFAAIFEKAFDLIVTDSAVMAALARIDGTVNRSLLLGKCPCGSGRRFDKCHGKAYR